MAALPLIVFDVNETLLDLETMEPTFQRIFGEKSAMRLCPGPGLPKVRSTSESGPSGLAAGGPRWVKGLNRSRGRGLRRADGSG
jgi:hypothetical protein